MDYIRNYKSFRILESTSKVEVIKKGTELFHATGEDFDVKKLRGGGYDNILWTTFDSGISQTYIPVSSTGYTNADNYTYPPNRNFNESFVKKYKNPLGIVFKDIEYKNGMLTSYIAPEIFDQFNDRDLYNEYISKERELDNINKELRSYKTEDIQNNKDLYKDLIKKSGILYDEVAVLKDKYYADTSEIKKRKYVNKLLRDLGYKPTVESKDFNHNYKLKVSFKDGEDVILPASYRSKGKLLILKPKKDLRIFDGRKSLEGDLTDVEYHNIELFRNIEKEGYDGILINDFAQIESEGNFGHKSIGLFNDTIKKMNINVIEDVEHPNEEEINRMYKTKNWASKEYLEN